MSRPRLKLASLPVTITHSSAPINREGLLYVMRSLRWLEEQKAMRKKKPRRSRTPAGSVVVAQNRSV